MARVAILRIGGTLLASVPEDLNDHTALDLQMDLNATIERTSAQGVLLDVSVLDTIDSFLGRLLNEIAIGARLLGAETVVVGIQPAIAVTLVELGLELRGIKTARDIEKGLAMLANGHQQNGRTAQNGH